MFSQLHKSLVRPILGCAAPVWSRYLIKDVEKVQKRTSRLALRQKRGEMSYERRCSLLKWQTLEKRKKFFSLVQCYKIVFDIGHLSFPDFFDFAKSTRTRVNHDYKLYLGRAVCNCYKYSFFIRIVRKWNDLLGYIYCTCRIINYQFLRVRVNYLFLRVFYQSAIKFYLVLEILKYFCKF